MATAETVVREKASGRRPPYLPYSTFERALEALSRRAPTAPGPARPVLGFSAAQDSALISALRFLNLVEPDRLIDSAERTRMGRLLAARQKGRGEYAHQLLPLLKRAYRPILRAVDVERGTRADLAGALLEVGGVLPGQMLARTIRFLVKALEDCGVTLSPNITRAQVLRKGAAVAARGASSWRADPRGAAQC